MDFSELDVILISNYQNMLALPYLTEGTDFKGVVYATEPTLQIARHVEIKPLQLAPNFIPCVPFTLL